MENWKVTFMLKTFLYFYREIVVTHPTFLRQLWNLSDSVWTLIVPWIHFLKKEKQNTAVISMPAVIPQRKNLGWIHGPYKKQWWWVCPRQGSAGKGESHQQGEERQEEAGQESLPVCHRVGPSPAGSETGDQPGDGHSLRGPCERETISKGIDYLRF